MQVGLLGRKVGMTQIYQEDGTSVPVTVLECGPCTVLLVRTEDRDGYHAVQLGFDDKKRRTPPRPSGAMPARSTPNRSGYVREVRQPGPADVTEGQTLTVELFQEIKHVDVTGTSKGRGFAGVIKRHGFRGLRATHGVKRMHRHPGSSGPSADPARTQKGIRKPGHYGHARSTVRNLEVVKIDAANNLLLIRGAVPGPARRLPDHPPDEQGLRDDHHRDQGGKPGGPFLDGFTIMLTIPVFNTAGEQVGQETIDPADFGGEINKQLLHDVVLMHLAARRVGTVNTRGRADVAGSGKKLFRQKGTGNARVGAKRTNKRKGGGIRLRPAQPRLPLRHAQEGCSRLDPDGTALQVSGQPGPGPGRTEPDQAANQGRGQGAAGHSPARSDRDRGRRGRRRDQDPGVKRTLEGRSVLIGIPGHDPVLYRSARNIEGVAVAPVSEFNTYDILKRRYLVLTREALAALKQRGKDNTGTRDSTAATQPAAGPES